MRKQFKDTVLDLASTDTNIVVILGDVSVYLFNEFSNAYPDRFYNMGILENTLVSASAGLSSQGLIPFVHTIAPFITERSFEQIKLDFCYNQFSGNIVSCGASFDYAWDGPTHQSYADIELLRTLPNIEIIQPGSTRELEALLRSQYNNTRLTYFRLSDYPHSIDTGPTSFGKACILKECGAKTTVVTAGPLLESVKPACDQLDVNLVYYHTIKPLDIDSILRFKDTRLLVFHDAHGLYESICKNVPGLDIQYHGLPDEFIACYGTRRDILGKLELDTESIIQIIQSYERQ